MGFDMKINEDCEVGKETTLWENIIEIPIS
jgi:hypothetical protein